MKALPPENFPCGPCQLLTRKRNYLPKSNNVALKAKYEQIGFNGLKERDMLIIKHHLGIEGKPHHKKETAKLFCMSEERVRQIVVGSVKLIKK